MIRRSTLLLLSFLAFVVANEQTYHQDAESAIHGNVGLPSTDTDIDPNLGNNNGANLEGTIPGSGGELPGNPSPNDGYGTLDTQPPPPPPPPGENDDSAIPDYMDPDVLSYEEEQAKREQDLINMQEAAYAAAAKEQQEKEQAEQLAYEEEMKRQREADALLEQEQRIREEEERKRLEEEEKNFQESQDRMEEDAERDRIAAEAVAQQEEDRQQEIEIQRQEEVRRQQEIARQEEERRQQEIARQEEERRQQEIEIARQEEERRQQEIHKQEQDHAAQHETEQVNVAADGSTTFADDNALGDDVWYKYSASTGQEYYHNPKTNETTWSRPTGATILDKGDSSVTDTEDDGSQTYSTVDSANSEALTNESPGQASDSLYSDLNTPPTEAVKDATIQIKAEYIWGGVIGGLILLSIILLKLLGVAFGAVLVAVIAWSISFMNAMEMIGAKAPPLTLPFRADIPLAVLAAALLHYILIPGGGSGSGSASDIHTQGRLTTLNAQMEQMSKMLGNLERCVQTQMQRYVEVNSSNVDSILQVFERRIESSTQKIQNSLSYLDEQEQQQHLLYSISDMLSKLEKRASSLSNSDFLRSSTSTSIPNTANAPLNAASVPSSAESAPPTQPISGDEQTTTPNTHDQYVQDDVVGPDGIAPSDVENDDADNNQHFQTDQTDQTDQVDYNNTQNAGELAWKSSEQSEGVVESRNPKSNTQASPLTVPQVSQMPMAEQTEILDEIHQSPVHDLDVGDTPDVASIRGSDDDMPHTTSIADVGVNDEVESTPPPVIASENTSIVSGLATSTSPSLAPHETDDGNSSKEFPESKSEVQELFDESIPTTDPFAVDGFTSFSPASTSEKKNKRQLRLQEKRKELARKREERKAKLRQKRKEREQEMKRLSMEANPFSQHKEDVIEPVQPKKVTSIADPFGASPFGNTFQAPNNASSPEDSEPDDDTPIGNYETDDGVDGDDQIDDDEDSIEGWERHLDEQTGKYYYYNPTTDESTWEPPN